MLLRATPVLLGLVLLTGCGGDDATSADAEPSRAPSSSASAEPSPEPSDAAAGGAALSKDEYLAQAEAVCTEANASINGTPEPATPEELTTTLKGVVATADTAATDLEQLTAPQPDAAELQRIFLTPLRGQVTSLTAFVPQVEAAVAEGEQALASLQGPDLPPADTAAMTAYGFSACLESVATE